MKKYLCVILPILVLLILLAVPAAAAETDEIITVSYDGYYDYQKSQEVLKYVNQYRAEAGVDPVVLDQELTELAMQRAAELVMLYGHDRPNGENCFTILDNAGETFRKGVVAENAAKGHKDAKSASESWYNSPGHYTNMVMDNHVSVGIGCFYSQEGGCYWIQLFSSGSSGIVCTASYAKEVTATVQTKSSLLDPQFFPTDQDGNLLLLKGKTQNVPFVLNYSSYPVILGDCYELVSANSSIAKASGRSLTGVTEGTTEVTFVISGLRRSIPVRVYAPLKLNCTVDNGTAVTTWEDPTGVAKLFYRKVGEATWHQPNREDHQYWQYINEGEVYEAVLRVRTDTGYMDVSDVLTITRDGMPSVEITTQPKTAYAKMGDTAKVTVKAKGDGLTYQWYIKNAGGSKYSKSSVTGPTYTCKMSEKSKDRRVLCIVTDIYGNEVQTKTVVIREAVSVITEPKNTYVKSGKTAKVTLEASGDGLSYQWYIKNAGGSKYSKSSVTSATYSCKMNDKSKDRLVYCVVTDKYGNTVKSKTIILRMAATITAQPKSVTAAEGKTATVTFEAAGDGLSYQWYVKNAGGSKFSKSSITAATYSCKMSQKTDGREIYCVVTDQYGKTAKTNVVTLDMV